MNQRKLHSVSLAKSRKNINRLFNEACRAERSAKAMKASMRQAATANLKRKRKQKLKKLETIAKRAAHNSQSARCRPVSRFP